MAGLFHDIATPCFSHVIDYMNNDYEKQESTEKKTEEILRNDKYLCECLDNDGILNFLPKDCVVVRDHNKINYNELFLK